MTGRKWVFGVVAGAVVFTCVGLNAEAKVQSYEINIGYMAMNVTGKTVQAIGLGKVGDPLGIPAPTLEFNEGDTLRVTFHNQLDESTSIHWHGLLLPNDQDGVPHITTPPIPAGKSFTYEYVLRNTGTYWYHSHTGLQEQRGVYGAIVIHPKRERVAADLERVVVLSDWTDRNPHEILHNLKTDPEWEQILKNTDRSMRDDVREGTLGARFKSEWGGMGPMDVADVAYDAFLINGQPELRITNVQMHQKVRLRIVNASASTYYYLGYGEQKFTIVAADGLDVEPVEVDQLRISMAETYDVIVEAPHHGATEFRATSMDLTGKVSLYVGSGDHVTRARDIPKPNPYDHGAHAGHGDHGGGGGDDHGDHGGGGDDHGDHGSGGDEHAGHGNHAGHVTSTGDDHGDHGGGDNPNMPVEFNYDMLRSTQSTALDSSKPTLEFELVLTGDMKRYVWSFNNTVLSDADFIKVRKNYNVRFKLVNTTMMHHPLHLHGHFFRVVNAQGDYSPLKHTVDIAPFKTEIIEFYASEEKDWLFHCHNLYHMETGMTRVVRYEAEPGHEGHVEHKTHKDMMLAHKGMGGNDWYGFGEGTVATTHVALEVTAKNHKYDLDAEVECDWDEDSCEGRANVTRQFSPNFQLYGAGGVKDEEGYGAIGVGTTLPFLIHAQVGIDTRGRGEYKVAREFYVADRLYLETEYGREAGDKTYLLGLVYRQSKNVSFEGGYSDKGVGIGVRVRTK